MADSSPLDRMDAEAPSLIVESLDPNCLMLLVEDEAGCEVVMRDGDGPKRYIGDVRLFRNGLGEPMVEIMLNRPDERVVMFLANVEKITVL